MCGALLMFGGGLVRIDDKSGWVCIKMKYKPLAPDVIITFCKTKR